jgi:hypothetical protein
MNAGYSPSGWLRNRGTLTLYKGPNAIESMFCRLKDCGRLATR